MEYKVLTLNLHTYQEEVRQNELDFYIAYREQIHAKIALLIEQEGVDFILFQEVGQHKDQEVIKEALCSIKKHNAMKEILDLCNLNYHYIYDFSHYGWNVWEEGIAVISKNPFISEQSFYVSSKQEITDFQSRKIIIGQSEIEGQRFFLCSVHLNWWNQGFQEEIEKIIELLVTFKEEIIILGGDFNNAYDTKGYHYFMKRCEEVGVFLQDSFLVVNEENKYQPTIREDAFAKNQRIDYIFLSREKCCVSTSKVFFTDTCPFGRVSDHYGVVTTFTLF